MELDKTKQHYLLSKVVAEIGVAANGSLITIADKLGLYKTLSKFISMFSQQLAATNTSEIYVREWISVKTAIGYVEYDVSI